MKCNESTNDKWYCIIIEWFIKLNQANKGQSNKRTKQARYYVKRKEKKRINIQILKQ